MSILRAPIDFARFVWHFINPSRTAGRIALGRFTIVVQIIAVLIFAGYTLAKKSIGVPFFAPSKYVVQVEFPDAKGLDTGDSPAAAVAGTPVGQVTDVQYQGGRALVTLSLQASVKGKIFANATAQLRPASALQNLLVNVDPGSPGAGPLPDDTPIAPEHTSSFVAIDEFTGILDADTQAYVSILLNEAQIALHGREGELRGALTKLGKLTDPATSVSHALATRRVLLTRLVGDLDVIFSTLGRRGSQLAEVINAGNHTLAVTDARQAELAAATRRLAPVLIEAQRSLAAVRALAGPLVPALDQLAPAGAPLASSLAKLRGELPQVKGLIGQFKGLEKQGKRPLDLLLNGTRGLTGRVRSLKPIATQLVSLTKLLDKYKKGGAQLADTFSGAFSTQDTGGPLGQVDVLGTEPLNPENFGLGAPKTGAAGAAQRKTLHTDVATALERLCVQQNLLACVQRFNTPGLPKRPVTAGGGG
jgi:phospholipid/cholesterol/gamma-HCH transport system substrate-binding protein